jgi:glucose/arabinose dehydrogenase
LATDDIPNTQPEGNKRTEKIQFYGCQKYPRLMHCDPVLNIFDSHRIKGTLSKVYQSSNQELMFASGRYGKALEMHDGYREYLEIPVMDNVSSGNFSVSFWIKRISDTSPYGHVISNINKNQTAGWFFDVVTPSYVRNYSSDQQLRFIVSNNIGNITGADHSVPLSNKFTNVVGTFDGKSVKVYKDGILFGTTKFGGNYTPNRELPLHIGSAAYCSSCNRWSGLIDDLLLYNRTLSDGQIKSIALNDSASSNFGDPVLHLTFDNNINDKSGNNNNGRMFGPISSMAFSPDGRMFFTEKNTGYIRIMKDNVLFQKPFAIISDHYTDWEQGLLGLTIDPNFTANHYVYVYYTALSNDNSGGNPVNRVVRFTEKNSLASDPIIILDNIPASKGFHSGGALAFGPDDKLYITVGDATEHEFAQDPSILIGKVLRINRDGTIPEDNPFPNSPVYTLGHRNMYGIALNQNDKIGIVTENGDYHYDEINLIQKQGNYGFPLFQPANVAPELSNDSTSIKPIRSYWNTIAPTQAIYYSGDKLPFLNNTFLFTTFTGDIYSERLDNVSKHITEEYFIDLQNYPFEPLIAIAQSPNGDIYLGGYNIYKLDESLQEGNNSKQKIVFPIEIVSPANVGIKGIEASDIKKYVIIDAYRFNNGSLGDNSSFLQIKIPVDLLNKINVIAQVTLDKNGNYQQYRKPMKYTLDSSNSEYTKINVQLSKDKVFRFFINGTSAIRPSAPTVILPPFVANSSNTSK